MYELPDGTVIALKTNKKVDAFTASEIRREKELEYHAAMTRQMHESRRAAAALKDETRKMWRKRQPAPPVPYTTKPRVPDDDVSLRFRKGDRVEVNLGTVAHSSRGRVRWQPGKVVDVDVHAPLFPAKHTMPYLVRLDLGSVLTIPVDDAHVIRRPKGESGSKKDSENGSENEPAPKVSVASALDSLAAASRRPDGVEIAQRELHANRRMPTSIQKAICAAIRYKVESRSTGREAWASRDPAIILEKPGGARARTQPKPLAQADGGDDPFLAAPALKPDEVATCRAALLLAQQAFASAPIELVKAATVDGIGAVCALLTSHLGATGSVAAPLREGPSAKAVIEARARHPETNTSLEELADGRLDDARVDYSRVDPSRVDEENDDADEDENVKDDDFIKVPPVAMMKPDVLSQLTVLTSVPAAEGSAEATDAVVASLAATVINQVVARRMGDAERTRRKSEAEYMSRLDRQFAEAKKQASVTSFLSDLRDDAWWAELDRVMQSADNSRVAILGPADLKSFLTSYHERAGESGGKGGGNSIDDFLKLDGAQATSIDKRRSMDEFLKVGPSADGPDDDDERRAKDEIDRLADKDGKRLKAALGLDGRDRSVDGLKTTRKHLTGMRWDDNEMVRFALLMERGEIALESMDVQAPNSVGSRGLRALCRALLIGSGAKELTALKLRADCATDDDFVLLGATLAVRDSAQQKPTSDEFIGSLKLKGFLEATRDEKDAEAADANKSGAGAVAFLAAPKLHAIDVDGGCRVTSLGRQAVSAARRARKVLVPASERMLRRLAQSASIPAPLDKFRKALKVGESASSADVQARRALFDSWDGNGSGAISLAELGSALLATLTNEYGKAGIALYHRYYRVYIRAFNDTRDGLGGTNDAADDDVNEATVSAYRVGGDYITRQQFKRLLSNLRLYALWYEVFLLIDGGTRGRTVEDDHRISRAEWKAALANVRRAGNSWAPFAAFAHASASDFDLIDRDRGGMISLEEWIKYVRASEGAEAAKARGTQPAAPTGPRPPPYPASHPSKEAFEIRDGRLVLRTEEVEHGDARSAFNRLDWSTSWEAALKKVVEKPEWLDAYRLWLQDEAPEDLEQLKLLVVALPLAELPTSESGPRAIKLCEEYYGITQESGPAAVSILLQQAQQALSSLISGSLPRFTLSKPFLALIDNKERGPPPSVANELNEFLSAKDGGDQPSAPVYDAAPRHDEPVFGGRDFADFLDT